ncbi:tRNA lysidine(34) synthetase TilS [Alphaproteobacteria bacterium GH1-50]|uniref:tRNA(Ile)-lysidine synthase n=1 Tax=Kangsaoukella pontilimi TaxID=2691042 RepID=A0A7C9NFA8_9RHOB|nr:tRNA lysidine(34) synthetase TilS [Kangsaoukella pontilimi]
MLDVIDRRFGETGGPRRIGIAVSGGSDSLSLLHLMAEWGRADLMAATIDHGLRPEAAEEAAYVARFCEGLGIPHRTLRWRDWDGKGNLQDQARQARYRLLARWADRQRLDTVALGHTLDDQAETFLMRLAREAGLDGLSGMPQVFHRHDMRFDRPLLFERRSDLRAFLDRRGIRWVDDPTNEDEGFSRIKARRALQALEPLGIDVEVIGYSMLNLDFARTALAEHVREIALGLSQVIGGDIVFDRAKLRRQNPEILRKLISGALKWVSADTYPPRRDALSDVIAALESPRNMTLHGCLIMPTDMTVRIAREFNAIKGLEGPTNRIWDGRWRLNGPHAEGLEVRALGEALSQCPGWRDTGLPRQSLLASPAVWRGSELLAAPLAGLSNGWTAETQGRDDFAASLLSR